MLVTRTEILRLQCLHTSLYYEGIRNFFVCYVSQLVALCRNFSQNQSTKKCTTECERTALQD